MSFGNRMFFKSIRFKFILWYTLILAVTFSLFSIVLYYNFMKSLKRNLDGRLRSKAEVIVSSIDTYWETEKMEAIKDNINANVFSKINNINFAKIAQRWVKEKSNDPELLNIVVQIYNPGGDLIASSENSPGIPTFSKDILKYVLTGNRFDNLIIGNERLMSFRLFTCPVFENNKVAYIVQVASLLSPVYTALNRLKFILFLLLPLTVFLTSVIAGEFLASLTLRPLNRMIHTARQITAENMRLRIHIPDSKDEIKQLANTFNTMLDKIEKSFVSQRQFVQDISHELRTPLTVLKGELEIALKKNRSQDEYSIILRSNLEEINKINRIVENLLMLMRFDTEEIALKIESLNLTEVLKDVLGDMKLLADQKNIAINLIAQESILLNADKEKISRLFINLFDNAIKYTLSNGAIDIQLKQEKNMAEIRIKDTGIGIEEEDLPFIFDRFYRVDKSREQPGFGLGLSIVKSIVEAHNGKIEVKSRPNKGTMFIIRLPLSSYLSLV